MIPRILLPVMALVLILGHAQNQTDRQRPVWYEHALLLDITGDGVPDSLQLRALGERPDSLDVTFRIVTRGREVYSDAWPSSAYFVYDPVSEFAEIGVGTHVRLLLESFFHEIQTPSSFAEDQHVCPEWVPSRFPDPTDPRDFIARNYRPPGSPTAPFDTTEVALVWEDILDRTPVVITYYGGYEAVLSIAWSNRAERIFLLYACC